MNANLAPYQERVITEKAELDVRISKLDTFIHDVKTLGKIPGAERKRLRRQLTVMRQYSAVLNERIDAFIA